MVPFYNLQGEEQSVAYPTLACYTAKNHLMCEELGLPTLFAGVCPCELFKNVI